MHTLMCSLALALAFVTTQSLFGIDIFVKISGGEVISLDVDPNETIGDVIEQVNNYINERSINDDLYFFDFLPPEDQEELLPKANFLREYHKEPSKSHVEAMRYIVLTLGNRSEPILLKYEKKLDKEGKKIDVIHPLHFWRVIFTHNDTTAAIHSIKRKKMVWKRFIKGMGESLEEAADRNNIQQKHIEDFANRINIDRNLFEKYLKERDWEGFAKALLTHVPRPEGTGRYDQ